MFFLFCFRILEHDKWNLRARQMMVILALAKDGDLTKVHTELFSAAYLL